MGFGGQLGEGDGEKGGGPPALTKRPPPRFESRGENVALKGFCSSK